MCCTRQMLVSTTIWNVFSEKKLAMHSARTCLLTAVMSGATRSCNGRESGRNTMKSKIFMRSSGGRSRSRNGGPVCLFILAHASAYMLSRARLSASLTISSKFLDGGVALALLRFDLLLGATVFCFLRISFLASLLVCAIHLSKFFGVAPPLFR